MAWRQLRSSSCRTGFRRRHVNDIADRADVDPRPSTALRLQSGDLLGVRDWTGGSATRPRQPAELSCSNDARAIKDLAAMVKVDMGNEPPLRTHRVLPKRPGSGTRRSRGAIDDVALASPSAWPSTQHTTAALLLAGSGSAANCIAGMSCRPATSPAPPTRERIASWTSSRASSPRSANKIRERRTTLGEEPERRCPGVARLEAVRALVDQHWRGFRVLRHSSSTLIGTLADASPLQSRVAAGGSGRSTCSRRRT